MSACEDDPIGWRVHLLPPPRDKLDGVRTKPYQVEFKTQDEATAYKRLKQAQGWVASVSPVFLSPQIRGKLRKKSQGRCAPPDFNHDWRLTGSTVRGGG